MRAFFRNTEVCALTYHDMSYLYYYTYEGK